MASEKVVALRRELEAEVQVFREIDQDAAKASQLRQQSLQQQHENEMVIQELELQPDGAPVYKLIGPALVRQEVGEARANVNKRLEYIAGEVKRLDAQMQGFEEKQQKKQGQLMRLQQEIQKVQQAAAAAAAGPS